MKHIKNTEGFLHEAIFGGSLGLLMSPWKERKNRFSSKEDILYRGYIIPVWTDSVFGCDVFGIPRKEQEPMPQTEFYFAYSKKDLAKMKSLIDASIIEPESQGTGIDFASKLPTPQTKVPSDLSKESKW